jgi:hypothetical protein
MNIILSEKQKNNLEHILEIITNAKFEFISFIPSKHSENVDNEVISFLI